MARIAWFFDVPDESTLPERHPVAVRQGARTARLPAERVRQLQLRPERFSAWFAHYQQLHEPTEHLDEADREMIAVVVSAYNRCTYCIVSHGHALRVALGGDLAAEVLADHIATNWRHADLDDRRRAICAYAEKLTATPHLMSEADLEALAAVGLTDDEVWDVVEIASMYNFTNRMALATGQQPNERVPLPRPRSDRQGLTRGRQDDSRAHPPTRRRGEAAARRSPRPQLARTGSGCSTSRSNSTRPGTCCASVAPARRPATTRTSRRSASVNEVEGYLQ